MTTIYLIRHSKPQDIDYNNNDSFQIQNEKQHLSKEGIELALNKLNIQELKNIDALYSSNYTRAIETAKYISLFNNNIDININNNLGERKFGINSWNELPNDFYKKQFIDENYKINNGESRKEVKNRMYNTIIDIINKNKDRKIAIVSHATAITFLLKKWCNIEINNNKLKCSFNNNVFYYGSIDYCEIFKLIFDNNKLINIENII